MNASAELQRLFDLASRTHPDLMERYVILLGSANDAGEKQEIMRRGLRETIKQRYPLQAEEHAA